MAANQLNNFIKEGEATFNAFSGADIVAYIGAVPVAKLQAITVSITREVMPIFVMGDPSPKTFVKGKRAIAGNLVFSQFDRHAVLSTFAADARLATLGEVVPDLRRNSTATPVTGVNASTVSQDDLVRFSDLDAAVAANLNQTISQVAKRRIMYADQIPPFSVTITMVNEMGAAAAVSVLGIQLVNEGWGYTLDDLNSEAAYTFVARAVTPLASVLDLSRDAGAVGVPAQAANRVI